MTSINPKKRKVKLTRYQRLKAAGTCTACGRAPARPGRVTCGPCGKHHVLRENARQKALAPILERFHLCRECRCRERIPGKKVCGYCLEADAECKARKRARHKAAGKCLDCPRPVVPGMSRCQRCLNKAKANHKTRRMVALGGAA